MRHKIRVPAVGIGMEQQEGSVAMPLPLEGYALLGDCETAALVGIDGSVDWLCWPRFDSAACFAALLGGPEHGCWKLAPDQPPLSVRRAYRDDTLVLETVFDTADGQVALIDFMPPRGENSDLVRIVEGRRGSVCMEMDLCLRFDYGRTVPWVMRDRHADIAAVAGPHLVTLRTPLTLQGGDFHTRSRFAVRQGERIPFVLTYGVSHLPPPAPVDAEAALVETMAFWEEWACHCRFAGEWSEEVRRSLLVLKALTYRPTGGIVAAATTSLPERLGGARNWDYRYCWLRDSTFLLLALMDAGYTGEAQAWRGWLNRAVAGRPEQLQIMYGIAGERFLPEVEIPWLPGYEGSAPVRIGNGAAGQLQLDVYGEVADAMYQAQRRGLEPMGRGWDIALELMAHLESVWHQPDEGIWEMRGPRRHFVHSKVMAWVAFDRVVRAMEENDHPGPLDRWRRVRDAIHAQVCDRGFDPGLGCFVQAYDCQCLDASLLLLPLVGFLPADDPRILATTAMVERRLMRNGLVMRYDPDRVDDGVGGGEGVFLACSFWLADNWILQGRVAEARRLFDRLRGIANDVGLLAEEYDVDRRRMVGNFPQAFSHVALVNTALNLARAVGPAEERSH